MYTYTYTYGLQSGADSTFWPCPGHKCTDMHTSAAPNDSSTQTNIKSPSPNYSYIQTTDTSKLLIHPNYSYILTTHTS